ncbi:MAG: phosphate acyltransferase PlsX [Anaerolineales bacterium]|nr:phosphate acyltransferase PlsX [Anaerolineales bacterium]HEY61204.1 phosphate acyltransferase PlsX [Anaerolineae bacterium]
MRIVLDAMGSDSHPIPEIQATLRAVEKFGDDIFLVGQKDVINPLLENQIGFNKVHVIHAPEVLEMTDKPSRAARKKAQNSMAIGMDLIKTGEADAFVTAGNTGGAMTNALFRLGRIKGVKRPALTTLFPVSGGHTVVLDIGANADCKPEYLLQFAIMGSIYSKSVLSINNPRVGLLSNGEESGKGNALILKTYPLLKNSKINFVGNIEPKELFEGRVDVAITDGFTGNVLLKTSEAVAKLLIDIIRKELTSNLLVSLGALLTKPAFANVKKIMDPGEVGAAPLLGIDGLIFVGHGRSDSHALFNAIKIARQAVDANLLESLQNGIRTKLVG